MEKEKSKSTLIITVSTNDSQWLEQYYEGLEQSNFTDFDLMIVDNACTDDTRKIVDSRALAATVIHLPERRGYSETNNFGFRQALEGGYKYLYLLNPDTIVHPDAIGQLIQFLDEHPQYGILGSRQIDFNATSWDTNNTWTNNILGEAKDLGNVPYEKDGYRLLDHYFVQGAALMLRVRLIPYIGMLDTVYVTMYEETDLCRRCLFSGHKVALLFNSCVKHFGGGNWKNSYKAHLERDHLFLRNQFLYFLSDPQKKYTFINLLRKQLRHLRSGEEELITPIVRYPLILFAFLARLNYISTLRQRNEKIISGSILTEDTWQIGPNHVT